MNQEEIDKHLEYRRLWLIFNPDVKMYYPKLSTELGYNEWVYLEDNFQIKIDLKYLIIKESFNVKK
ncbi:TPA: hypothetical protein I9009_001730 [Clostridium perfringens]|nr:hypothetical protein [Clostridium perfringens]